MIVGCSSLQKTKRVQSSGCGRELLKIPIQILFKGFSVVVVVVGGAVVVVVVVGGALVVVVVVGGALVVVVVVVKIWHVFGSPSTHCSSKKTV